MNSIYTTAVRDKYYSHLIHIKEKGKSGLYNAVLKKLVIPCEYEIVSVVQDLNPEIVIMVKKGYYGFINEWGNIVTPCIFENILNRKLPFLLVKGKLVGMLSNSVHYIKPEYQSIDHFDTVKDSASKKSIYLLRVITSDGKNGIINGEGFRFFKD